MSIGYRGSQDFINYSTRIPLKANPTKWDYALLTVEGGTPPYTVVAGSGIVEVVPQGNKTQFSVFARKAGTTIITIKDGKGATLKREVVVFDPSQLPLALGALPNAANPVALGQGRGFGISGGKHPYSVTVANPAIARVEGPTAAGLYMVWGVGAGSTEIVVTDAVGQKSRGTVQVGTTKPLLVVAPASMLVGGTDQFRIDSGNPPYAVTTSANLTATLSGNAVAERPAYKLVAKGLGQASVTVKDAKGQSQTKTIQIQDAVTIAFPELTGELRTIDVGQSTTMAISGGKAPFTVVADKPALVTIQQVGMGRYRVTGSAAGVVGFTAKDAAGATRSLSLTVRNLPVLTLAVPDTLTTGVPATLSLIGGAAPFTVSASGSVLTLTKVDDKKYTVTPKAPGSAVLSVKDSKGTAVQKTIVVKAPALTLSGATGPLPTGHTRSFDIKGGVGPYTLTVSNANATAVLAATTAGYTRYNVTGVRAGEAVLTVKDSTGNTVTTKVAVQTAATPLKLYVSSTALDRNATGAAAIRTLSIEGGTAPYTTTVSNNVLVLTKVNATQYQMVPKVAGVATIVVKDAKGASATQAVTVK